MAQPGNGFTANIPFVSALGIERVASGEGESELRLVLRPDQENHVSQAHGGVIMTLLDVAMAQAARTVNPEASVVTIEMKTTFFQPAQGVLTARGRLLHRTARMAYLEATLLDAQGRRCAHSTGTFRYIEAAAERPRAPA